MQKSRPGPSGLPHDTTAFPIIAHCHLRWDFVWQRPQQILSRFAARHPVLFVEDPQFDEHGYRASLALADVAPGVVRAVPHIPWAQVWGETGVSINAIVRGLLRVALGKDGPLDGRFERPVHWFYTPMPAPKMLGAFGARAVVYDCMDELSQFRHAPADIAEREQVLLAAADIVFTGGFALYAAKSRRHHDVHAFGCGVDVDHFARARDPRTAVPADVAFLPRPVLGYYGVIDERLDYALLAALADAHPDWSIVMVGPVAKVEDNELPRRANIHWLGQRGYDELPAYARAFDVCLMPFARNAATEFINPTKTLEYMAAGRPIVSTAIADVVRQFSTLVDVAATPDAFLRLARRAAEAPDAARIAAGIERARAQSWDAVVAMMRQLIIERMAGSGALAAEAADRAAGHRRAVAGGDAMLVDTP